MRITKRQLRRIIKEEIDRMAGLPEDTSTMTVEVEWYPPPRDEEEEGTMYVIPLSVGKQGHDAVRDYIDGKFYPRHKYIFSKGGADEINMAMAENKMKITKRQLRKVIEEAKSWAERQAEMDAWEKKLAAALPKDPSKMSNADHEKIAKVFIDEYGLDQADAFYEDDRGTLADLGVTPYPDLENIRMAISLAQDAERKANISKSPDMKELQAIDAGLEPREVAYLTYQPIRRGGKVVAFQIEDSETPFGTMPLGHSTFTVDERQAQSAGTTIDKIIKVLEKGGAKLRKRRKPIKHTPPMYD